MWLGALVLMLLLLQRYLEPRWTPAAAWGVAGAGALGFLLSWGATRWNTTVALPLLVAASPLFSLVVLALGFLVYIWCGFGGC